MRNFILLLASVVAIGYGGCSKKDKPCEPVSVVVSPDEIARVEQYLRNKGISAEKDDRGFYYTIEALGTGDHPSACANVTVNYSGTLTNGTVFDARNGISFNLDGLIAGWRMGIPLIAKGGKVILYLPPSLAYGAYETNGIPGNSILIFHIDLVGIND